MTTTRSRRSAAETVRDAPPSRPRSPRFWETTGPAIYHGRALGRQCARTRGHAERAPVRGAVAGYGRRLHRGLRGQVPLQLLAARHRDPQRRPRRQRRDRAGCVVDCRSSIRRCIPSIRARTASSPSTVGTVLQAEVGSGTRCRSLTTSSPTAKGPTRNWTKIDDFVQEVSVARIYDGVHYRNSTEVGSAMGKQIGGLAAAKLLRRPD